jgi:FkbM family methyltransferase
MTQAWILEWMPQRSRLPIRHAYERLFRNLGREMRALRPLVAPGGVAIDVGAGVGLYSYAFARFCARVEAFEPNPQSASAIRAYRNPAITVHEVALSSSEGVAELFLPIDAAGRHPSAATLQPRHGAGERLAVRKATLDSFGFRNVSLLKVDVEGHERDVLRGARELILRERPLMYIEIEQRHLDIPMQDVFQEIAELGYEGSFLDGGRRVSIQEFDPHRHQVAPKGNRMMAAYVNNFIFVPQERGGVRLQGRV